MLAHVECKDECDGKTLRMLPRHNELPSPQLEAGVLEWTGGSNRLRRQRVDRIASSASSILRLPSASTSVGVDGWTARLLNLRINGQWGRENMNDLRFVDRCLDRPQLSQNPSQPPQHPHHIPPHIFTVWQNNSPSHKGAQPGRRSMPSAVFVSTLCRAPAAVAPWRWAAASPNRRQRRQHLQPPGTPLSSGADGHQPCPRSARRRRGGPQL